MKTFKKELIESWKPLFEAYPQLKTIPVYAWGRYYKYESSGRAFENQPDEDGLSGFIYNLRHDPKIQWDLLQEIDNKHNIPGGEIWVGKWGGYLPDRPKIVDYFGGDDDGGGQCILIHNNDGEFDIEVIDCDSRE